MKKRLFSVALISRTLLLLSSMTLCRVGSVHGQPINNSICYGCNIEDTAGLIMLSNNDKTIDISSMNIPDINEATCQEVYHAGIDGLVPSSFCEEIQQKIQQECGCPSTTTDSHEEDFYDSSICYVCGGNENENQDATIKKPNHIVEVNLPSLGDSKKITCQEIYDRGITYLIPTSYCTDIQYVVLQECECTSISNENKEAEKPADLGKVAETKQPQTTNKNDGQNGDEFIDGSKCYICISDPAMKISNPSEFINLEFLGLPPESSLVSCYDIYQAGVDGLFTATECELLKSNDDVQTGCGCKYEDTINPSDDASSFSPSVTTIPPSDSISSSISDSKSLPGENTLADIISDSDDLSDFMYALEVAGLTDFLANNNRTFTIFAPASKDGYEQYLDTYLQNPEYIVHLQNVLFYHTIVDQVILSSDIPIGSVPLTMLNNGVVIFNKTIDDDDTIIMSASYMTPNNGSYVDVDIIETDLESINGVLHKLDGLLLPSFVFVPINILLTTPAPQYSIVTELFLLAYPNGLPDDEISRTVLAPTDDAFLALGNDTLDMLFDFTNGQAESLLMNHTIDQVLPSTFLVDGDNVTTVGGLLLTVRSISNEAIQFNDADVVAANILASDGIVHAINKVLLPPDSDIQPSDNPSDNPTSGDTSDTPTLIATPIPNSLSPTIVPTTTKGDDNSTSTTSKPNRPSTVRAPNGFSARIPSYP